MRPILYASRLLILAFGAVLASCHPHPVPSSNAMDSAAPPASAAPLLDAAVAEGDAASADASELDAPDAASWNGSRRIASQDGSFSLIFPSKVFVKGSAHANSISIKSNIFEVEGEGHGGVAFYELTLTKLRISKAQALTKALTPAVAKDIFPDGGESSFVPSPDFVTVERGLNGAHGYRVLLGVEGIGNSIQVITTHDGTTWQLDCNYCCGMVPSAKMTSDAQIALCDDIVHQFELEH